MLDHDHSVAQVAQLRQRIEQPIVVARVQPDRRFVKNVEHADQAAADLAGQANALRFAARERRRRAIERQIVEPHVAQKPQPATDFLEHFGGDQRPGRVEIERAEEINGVVDGQMASLGQRSRRAITKLRMPRGDRHRAGLRIQSLALALGAEHDLHVLFQLAQLHLAARVAVFVEQLGDDALELAAILVARSAAAPSERDVLVAGAIEPQVGHFLVELIPGCVEHRALGQLVQPLDGFGHALIDVPLPAPQVAPWAEQFEATLLERQLAVGYQQSRLERIELAQTIAGRAHALRAVEAEQLRARRLKAQATVRAGIVGR